MKLPLSNNESKDCHVSGRNGEEKAFLFRKQDTKIEKDVTISDRGDQKSHVERPQRNFVSEEAQAIILTS